MGVACVFAGAFGVDAIHAADEQAYTITYNRPVKAGETFEHEVKTTLLLQKTPVSDTLSLEQMAQISRPTVEKLEAKFKCEVLAVTPEGNRTKVKVTFAKLADTTLGKAQAVVPEGTQLVLTIQPKGEVSVEGVEPEFKITPAIKAKADKVVALKQRMELDTLLGGVKARKVGEAWALDKDLVLKSAGGDPSIAPKDPAGTAKLLRVETIKGVPQATTEIVMVVKGTTGAGELATGKLTEAGISVTDQVTLPINTNQPGWTHSRDWKMKVQMDFLETAAIKRLNVTLNEKREETVSASK